MNDATRGIAGKLKTALEQEDEELFASLLDPAVRWGGEEETPETCHSRGEVLAWYRKLKDAGISAKVADVIDRGDLVVLGLAVSRPERGPGSEIAPVVFQVFRLAEGLVVDIRGFPERAEALALVDEFDSGE
ncbi:MAG: nuclear transport factor 2 family protein [Actinobacteria bacterium]|nr:nuclear transport factor 2 family protein [Actinomycetota bacterium]